VPGPGQLALAVNGPQLFQQLVAVINQPTVGRINKGEALNITQPHVDHLQDHRSQIGATDLRVRMLRAVDEISLVIEPEADPGRNPPTPALSLLRASLGDWLDRETLYLGADAVATQPRASPVSIT